MSKKKSSSISHGRLALSWKAFARFTDKTFEDRQFLKFIYFLYTDSLVSRPRFLVTSSFSSYIIFWLYSFRVRNMSDQLGVGHGAYSEYFIAISHFDCYSFNTCSFEIICFQNYIKSPFIYYQSGTGQNNSLSQNWFSPSTGCNWVLSSNSHCPSVWCRLSLRWPLRLFLSFHQRSWVRIFSESSLCSLCQKLK